VIPFGGSALLLDIEGTTSSVRFVYDVLFPFARHQLVYFLTSHWEDADVQQACERIAQDAGGTSLGAWSGAAGRDDVRAQVVAEVQRLMDADAKATGLKALQGLIWREGYLSGKLCSHVYGDVPPALRRWQEAGRAVCIYSSGSVTAQKLFFAHTTHGDLTCYLNGYYDTTTGPKRETASYSAIAHQMDFAPSEILFCSDMAAELDAAAAAGLMTALAIRPENAPAPAGHGHATITSFEQIHVI
jgi:enolase-phosphatase E1